MTKSTALVLSTFTLFAAIATSAPRSASAQAPSSTQQSLPRSGERQENGEYTAPLQQQTQPTYIPQSVALSGPPVIKDYQDGDPVPVGYHKVARIRKGLVGGGAGLFGGLYLASAIAAATSIDLSRYCTSCTPAGMLFIPFFGPLIEMGFSGRGSAVASVFLAIDAIGQGAGIVMFALGFALPKIVLVRDDLAAVKPTLEPYLTGSGGGVKVTF